MVSGPTRLRASLTDPVPDVASSSLNGVDANGCWRRCRDHELDACRQHLRQRALECGAFGREHEAGLEPLEDLLKRAVVPGLQRVRGRDWRIGNADVHRRQRQQGMVDPIARQDQDRPFGRQLPIEQRLRDASDAVERVRVSQRAPATSQIALREKDPTWSFSGPVLESVGDPIGIRAERLRRR